MYEITRRTLNAWRMVSGAKQQNVYQDPCANQDCSNERACDTSTGTCMYKECVDDVVLLNGEILGNMKQVGGKIKYICNSGLNVRDNKENAECLANGQWSQTAECISGCGEVPTISNGYIIIDTVDINKALITCDPGYQANPSSTIFCVQGSSTWGGPSCETIVCGNPDPISNGNIALTVPGSYNYLDTADVTCSSGYQANVNLITCKIDGDWETASCDRISCGSLPTIAHGVASLSVPGASQYQDTAVVTCDAWFQTSTSLITCTASGSWTSASCTDVMCYTGTPWQYQGQVSVTFSGRTCQRWDTNTPHQVLETYLQYFQGNTLSEASNFCRNPAAGSDNPWCYTTDPSVTWEYCAVVPC
ncbi:sushi, von Willebrand factor type A, EGF and pentraxin domain-containing protein 1-like [Ruditapes philippinarum]|uniref:sushi, von Willebrand factor type A, EGF and pentraxin domain-containing protein 1-like n=1 Tax=Ruditapes philippinarum TaxID=129788 RepID=UPI00295B92F9|nr:sushi, von Willebrand factor type A, EGF and pentraxin domain-containing protein 1-like [Ruditapes philippinarum]